MRAALLLLVPVLLAGCSLPEDASGPGAGVDAGNGSATGGEVGGAAAPCQDVAEASRNAPLLATLQEDPEHMAGRLAQAMGTTISGPPDPREDGSLVWRDGAVSVTVVRGEDDVRVSWERAEAWRPDDAEANATLRRALDAFQPRDLDAFRPHDTNPGGDPHLVAFQTYEGRAIGDAGARVTSGAMALVEVFSLREIRPGIALMAEDEAAERATRAARCALDQEGMTEAEGHATLGTQPVGLGVRGGSLAYVVNVRFAEPGGESHCAHVQQVHVDAVTGKTLGVERPPCD